MSGAEVEINVRVFGHHSRFHMPRDGRTVLEGSRAAGIELPYSCEAGCCSTCRAKLLNGRVRMRNNLILDEAEQAAGYVLACQAEPESASLSLDFDA
jgi:ring-1,2-phenylacetyl-CoA epoxidase subunit PaaE